jgi:2-amino-4-hydroxy-6-hydroxymethyldihydropteridine diphosphokinase
MNTAYLSLGTNEGDRKQWLHQALSLIAKHCGHVTKQSAIYETAAWGITDQSPFLNMVVRLETSLSPGALLSEILTIEVTLGRHRTIKWGPRIIDIDILFYNDDIINTPSLTIPHPFIEKRRFTLVPLVDIEPYYFHPLLHKTSLALLSECKDDLEVHPY